MSDLNEYVQKAKKLLDEHGAALAEFTDEDGGIKAGKQAEYDGVVSAFEETAMEFLEEMAELADDDETDE
jgi:hypothetical protein